MIISKSAARYSERIGAEPTRRRPVPRLVPGRHRGHSYVPVTPNAELLHGTQGEPPPDRGITRPWPEGEFIGQVH